MGSARFWAHALMHGRRNTRNRLKTGSVSDCVEEDIDTASSDIEVDDRPRSVCFTILFHWGLFEMFILTMVLLKNGRKNYGDQVIHKLCENDCPNYITNGLIIRLLLALYMTLGAFRSNWILCLPWLLIDSFGFFPLIPIVISAFYKYDDFWAIADSLRAI